MPTSEQILQGLTEAAIRFEFLAFFWHLVFLFLLVLIFSGKRPADRMIALILALPLTSVAMVALLTSNPFNAIVFGLAAVLMFIIAFKIQAAKSAFKWDFISIFGILMIIYGWVYPHFLENPMLIRYLYASPLGLVPCPTLSLIIGFTLLFHGFNSKRWMLTLGIFGLFYAVVGIFRLKVLLDIGLLVGVMTLLFYALVSNKKTQS
jgi:hypothetical protein